MRNFDQEKYEVKLGFLNLCLMAQYVLLLL